MLPIGTGSANHGVSVLAGRENLLTWVFKLACAKKVVDERASHRRVPPREGPADFLVLVTKRVGPC